MGIPQRGVALLFHNGIADEGIATACRKTRLSATPPDGGFGLRNDCVFSQPLFVYHQDIIPIYLPDRSSDQSEGYRQRLIDRLHRTIVDGAFFLSEAAFVQCTHLLEQDDAVALQPAVMRFDRNMGGEFGFIGFAGDRGGDHGGGIAVADVVLDDQYGAYASLFRAY